MNWSFYMFELANITNLSKKGQKKQQWVILNVITMYMEMYHVSALSRSVSFH